MHGGGSYCNMGIPNCNNMGYTNYIQNLGSIPKMNKGNSIQKIHAIRHNNYMVLHISKCCNMDCTIQVLQLHNRLQYKHCNQIHYQILLHYIKETSMVFLQTSHEISLSVRHNSCPFQNLCNRLPNSRFHRCNIT